MITLCITVLTVQLCLIFVCCNVGLLYIIFIAVDVCMIITSMLLDAALGI